MKCGSMVQHHRKSEKVKAHLNRCRPFLNSLQGPGLFDADIPHWVVLRNDGRKKNNKTLRTFASPDTTLTSASNAYTTATTAATRTPSKTTASSKKPRANRTMHDYLIPPLSAIDQAAFQERNCNVLLHECNAVFKDGRASFARIVKETSPGCQASVKKGFEWQAATKCSQESQDQGGRLAKERSFCLRNL